MVHSNTAKHPGLVAAEPNKTKHQPSTFVFDSVLNRKLHMFSLFFSLQLFQTDHTCSAVFELSTAQSDRDVNVLKHPLLERVLNTFHRE